MATVTRPAKPYYNAAEYEWEESMPEYGGTSFEFGGTGGLDNPDLNYLGPLANYAAPPGSREQFLDQFFREIMAGGESSNPVYANLSNILKGEPAIADEAIRAQKKYAKQQYRRDQANTTESFGQMGARFGTDIVNAHDLNSQNFREGLYSQEMALRTQLAENAKNRSLQAYNQILGLGQYTSGLEFTRGESSASRWLEQKLQELRNSGALDVAGLQAEAALDQILLEYGLRLP